ncbi:MAG: histone H1-like repetitive region-containing protein [Sandaracinaceae bacterium]|nr:histone H1-like repetitive region-containing protein [Sandaracinaceae bacterium]
MLARRSRAAARGTVATMKKSAKGRAGAKSSPAAKKKAAKMGAKKTVAKRPAAKKTVAVAKKTVAKKTVAKKTVAKKTVAKKTVAKKTVAKKKTAAKKTVAKKAPSKPSARSTTAPAKKSAAAKADAAAARAKPSAAKPSAATPSAGEARADEALVDRSMELLHAHDERVADSVREIGEHLLESYFGGDEQLARSRVARRPLSYERLAARAEAETSWDAADLRRAVTAALVSRSLPSALAERVPATYLVRLDSVDDPSVRAELAARIANLELRGHAAKEAITLASVGRRRGGRPPTPGPIRLANGLERLLDRSDDFGGLDPSAVQELDQLARASLAGRIDDVARRLAALAARIRAAR